MFVKTITFKDLDGNSVTEDFYFHFNKAELAEMELEHKGGLGAYVERIIKADERGKLVGIFKDLILKSVGRRSEDGRRFIKNQEIRDDFVQTEAYSELFMELATVTDSAVAFINGLVPKSLLEEAQKQVAAGSSTTPSEPVESNEQKYNRLLQDPNWEPDNKDFPHMTPDQVRQAFTRKQAKVTTDPTE